MTSHQPKDVNGFVGEREHARGPTGKYPQAGLSHVQPPRVPAHDFPQQGPNFPPKADLAVRRQNTRQDIGKELRMVGPPMIYNPDELPPKKRSAATLIEKAQGHILRDPGEDIAALASQVASFNPFNIKTTRDTFADTTSIMTTDTDAMAYDEEYNEHVFILATDYNKRDPASNPNLKHVSSDHATQMRGQIIPEEEEEDYIAEQQARARESSAFGLGPDWKEQVEAEKERFYARRQRASTKLSDDYDNYAGAIQYNQPGDAESNYYDYGYDDNDNDHHEYHEGPRLDWVDDADADGRVQNQTNPMAGQSNRISQADTVRGAIAQKPLTKVYAGNAGVAEPAVELGLVGSNGNHVAENTGSNTMVPPPKPAPATKQLNRGKQAIRNTDFAIPVRSTSPRATFTKIKDTAFGSSSPSPTSENEMVLANETGAAAHKRNLEESLDYTREQLADMSYNELDTTPFLTDPHEPPRERVRNQNGVELTLEEKLSKMTDMTEDQCKAMFGSMTDAENEGTGQWFITKMQEDMEKLMIAKHKRRMIALKYEHEIKKRNSAVKAKMEDVEGELQGLKSGLGSLMPASKKDRREAAKAEKKAAKKAGL